MTQPNNPSLEALKKQASQVAQLNREAPKKQDSANQLIKRWSQS